MTEWKPGTVAVATVRGMPNVRVMARPFSGVGSQHVVWMHERIDGSTQTDEEDVTDIRPLVVLDPEDSEQVQRLVRAFWDVQKVDDGEGSDFAYMAEALRSLTRPPKPAEPTGLGALVEDDTGVKWAAHEDGSWVCLTDGPHRNLPWSFIDAAKVLWEGEQP